MNAARTLDSAKSSRLTRAIIRRTRGQAHGPLTRLMSPSDFGEILKPFVFLDLFDHEGAPFNGPLHPHSGIATLTYIIEGELSFIDPDDVRGTLSAGGVEWMQAGRLFFRREFGESHPFSTTRPCAQQDQALDEVRVF
jgi:redox-sensitive bicupin YhaK (pirin superfamily)